MGLETPRREWTEKRWCERGESNPHGLAPGGFSYLLRLSPPSLRGLGSGLSLHRAANLRSGLGAARLVSTPSRSVAPGLARDCHFTGFPEFEQFCIAGFPASTQVGLSPLRLPVPPRSHHGFLYSCEAQSRQENGAFESAVSAIPPQGQNREWRILNARCRIGKRLGAPTAASVVDSSGRESSRRAP